MRNRSRLDQKEWLRYRRVRQRSRQIDAQIKTRGGACAGDLLVAEVGLKLLDRRIAGCRGLLAEFGKRAATLSCAAAPPKRTNTVVEAITEPVFLPPVDDHPKHPQEPVNSAIINTRESHLADQGSPEQLSFRA